MKVHLRVEDAADELVVDLCDPITLAIEQQFDGRQPRHFGAPAAASKPFSVPGFSGAVASGASCNCRSITLIPHCNGTHTECVGHLTVEPVDAFRLVPAGLLPALLLSIQPTAASVTMESTDPAPLPGDVLVTRHAVESGWPLKLPFTPRALIIRTVPNEPDKAHRDYSSSTPPYLTRDAAELLVTRGIEHVVVDLPSLDRSHDEGRLTAHRVFFGLPQAASEFAQARRATCTVTELAFIPSDVPDGPYLLQLQVPALGGDAVPSRPLLFRL